MKPSFGSKRDLGLACLLALTSACQSDFVPASNLTQVRILGIRSQTPYVRPGASFTTEVLAYDGRAEKTRPMRLYWLNDVCVSPTQGEPEDCYRGFGAKYATNQDLTSMVTEGPTAEFEMPRDNDAGSGRPALPMALVFVAACAGHLEYVGSTAQFPSSVPFACFDEGRRLDANDFVFAFMRLYVSNDLSNENPAPTGVTLDGVPLALEQPLSIPVCPEEDVDDCPARKLAVTIGGEQQEPDPTGGSSGNGPLREQIWSNFFASSGEIESESLVLFDARHGRVSGAENEYRGPNVAGDVDLFVVTHDNRSGTAFQSFKLKAE